MILPLLLSTLLLSGSPVVAQYNPDDKCLVNKQRELQSVEEYLQMAIHKSQQCVYKHVIFVTTSFLASLLKSTDQIKKLLLSTVLL